MFGLIDGEYKWTTTFTTSRSTSRSTSKSTTTTFSTSQSTTTTFSTSQSTTTTFSTSQSTTTSYTVDSGWVIRLSSPYTYWRAINPGCGPTVIVYWYSSQKFNGQTSATSISSGGRTYYKGSYYNDTSYGGCSAYNYRVKEVYSGSASTTTTFNTTRATTTTFNTTRATTTTFNTTRVTTTTFNTTYATTFNTTRSTGYYQ